MTKKIKGENNKGGNKMNFQKFLELNKESLYRLADDNTYKNNDGEIVVKANDEWREEVEWEEYRS